MFHCFRSTRLAAAAAIILVGLPVRADGVKIGQVAPEWTKLPGTDDKMHSLSDLKSAKVVVVAFTCNHCPVAVAYEDRFVKFAKEYKAKGVEFVAVNVNNLDEDKLPAMKERAAEKKFPFAYIYDNSQKIGHAYGAQVTPHLFVLDKDRKIAYVGAFDDKMDAKGVKEAYVKNAVDALLAGKQPSVAETKASGCGIKYE